MVIFDIDRHEVDVPCRVSRVSLLRRCRTLPPQLVARALEHEAESRLGPKGIYPNVDFYSGVILRAIGIPKEMFTVMFAIGRMPGWIAQWHEENKFTKISRPRQVYTGATQRGYVPMSDR